ncbi:hypothetical protein VS884_26315, partial [Escherichia coli]
CLLLEPDVPLVVPEVNPFVLTDYRNRNVIAVPVIDSSGLFAPRTRRTAGCAGSKPVCTDRLPQPECHRRTG